MLVLRHSTLESLNNVDRPPRDPLPIDTTVLYNEGCKGRNNRAKGLLAGMWYKYHFSRDRLELMDVSDNAQIQWSALDSGPSLGWYNEIPGPRGCSRELVNDDRPPQVPQIVSVRAGI